MNGRVLMYREGADGVRSCGFASLFPLSFLADRNRSENVRIKSANFTLDPDRVWSTRRLIMNTLDPGSGTMTTLDPGGRIVVTLDPDGLCYEHS